MAYQKINFKDQVVERPRTYEVTNNSDGSVTLTDSFGFVEEIGTPINAETMGHIEDGIERVAISKYSSTETYNIGEWVLGEEESKLFKSLKDNNIGNLLTDSTSWEELKLGGGSGFNLFDTKLSDHILEGEEAKGWALQGTYVYKEGVSGVRDGYPDFYNKVLEHYGNATETKTEYLSSNVNIVGTLVNRQGVLSVFRETNYATLPNLFNVSNGETWEAIIKFKTASTFNDYETILANSNTADFQGLLLRLNASGKIQVYLGSTGAKWNIASGTTSTNTLLVDTNYYLKIEYTGSAYNFDISTDKLTWINYITVASAIPIFASSTPISLGTSGYQADNFLRGSIDLNESYINIGGVRWWSGVNTYKYQQSSNGLKFYDITDKSTIDEVFNNTGFAWFYGIDTENERVFLPRNIYLTAHIENKQHPVVGNGMTLGIIGAHRSGADVATGLGSCDEGDSNTENVRLMKYTGVPVGSRTGSYNTTNNNSVESIGITKEEDISGVVANIKNVQNGSYVYICVGNTNVETAVTEVVDVTTTENDTIPLFTGQYFDFTPNNLSWLKAGKQANSGDIYTTAYNELVNCLNGVNKYNLKVIDIADMVSDVDYSEYWKVNQTEMYFITPTKLSYGALTGGVVSNEMAITLSSVEAGSTPVENATIDMKNRGGANGTVGTSAVTGVTDSGILGFGNQTGLKTEESTTAQLYFKVANAVQNLELLNVGEITESLADKISRQDCVAYVTETFRDGASWYRVYSDGWCEQGGVQASSTTGAVTISFLKPYIDLNYIILKNYGSSGTTNISERAVSFYSKTETSATTYNMMAGANWYSCGYIA